MVGLQCKVPVQTNALKSWWVQITDVRYVNRDAAMVLCEQPGSMMTGIKRYGKPKWHSMEVVKFRGHIECPAAQAILKAQKSTQVLSRKTP